MSRREDIDNAIWSDPDFAVLSPNAKLIYLWSFTNPRCGMSGIYKVTDRAIVFECGISPEPVKRALTELSEGRFVFFVEPVMWVRSRVKHLRSTSPSIAKSIANDVAKLPCDHELVGAFVACYQGVSWLKQALSGVHPVHPVSAPSLPPIGGTGQGKGKGSSETEVGREDDARARELCDQLSLSCRKLTETPERSRKYHVTDAWVAEMDRLVRIDGRSQEMVSRAIVWAHNDSFWRRVILSPRKLREHFDQMAQAAKSGKDGVSTEAADRRRAAYLQQMGAAA